MDNRIIQKVSDIYLNTNFANLFAFPGTFKLQSVTKEFGTGKFERWLDSFKLQPVPNLWINAVNIETDKEEIYSYDDFNKYGYGELVARSIAIPGFINKGLWIDGGIAQNPPLKQWKDDTLPIFVSQLMMPHRFIPRQRISKLSYSWEFKAFDCYNYHKKAFKNLTTIYPMIDDIDSTDFGMNREKKEKIMRTAYRETIVQLDAFKIFHKTEPLEICLALSGGGIRSGAHLGVLQALLERNIIPVKWSGTSGGSIFAALIAGM